MVRNDPATVDAADEDESNFERARDDDGMVETTPSGDVVDDDLVTEDEAGGDDDGWFDAGVITLTLLVGLALFLFPEPLTSGVGVVLMGVGVVAWLVDWLG